MYFVRLEILRREYTDEKRTAYVDCAIREVAAEVKSKYDVFVEMLRNFGRCQKKINMGWRFERIEKFDDGTKRWIEYDVAFIEGAKPTGDFYLANEE